jgi:hypothetical protein
MQSIHPMDYCEYFTMLTACQKRLLMQRHNYCIKLAAVGDHRINVALRDLLSQINLM